MKVFQYPLLCVLLLLTISCVYTDLNRDHYLLSPDESLSFTFHVDQQNISYSLKKDGNTLIDQSQLGILADQFEFADDLQIKNVSRSRKNKTWTQVWGEQKQITDHHNELAIHVTSNSHDIQMIIRFRLFNDGLGFRYEIPEQKELNEFKTKVENNCSYHGINTRTSLGCRQRSSTSRTVPEHYRVLHNV